MKVVSKISDPYEGQKRWVKVGRSSFFAIFYEYALVKLGIIRRLLVVEFLFWCLYVRKMFKKIFCSKMTSLEQIL